MAGNQLDDLSPNLFRNMAELQILKLDNNHITRLHRDQFSGLEKLYDLYLSENKIEELPPGIFKGLRKLLSINLSDNKIRSVSLEHFKDVTQLRLLFLHNNEMNDLPAGLFWKMTGILRVTLDTNLMCCHLEFKEDAGCDFQFNDNFATCETMFRNRAPRISIWFIGSLSLVGAVFITVWRCKFKEKNVVQGIMLTNLAIADGLMGVYLTSVGVNDALWHGFYYLHDYKWRTGWMCQITGAICVLSSEVSVMLLALISADRVKNIVFPFQGKALTPNMAKAFCFVIWVLGSLMAFLPMFGIQYFNDPEGHHHYYGRSVVCLPLQLSADFPAGWEYSVSVFMGLNFVLFLFITVAYLMILYKSYSSSRRLAHQGTEREIQARATSSTSHRRETALARRVFCIILTDALCWFPVIIYGIKSLVEKTYNEAGDLAVWFAVFALPVNSAFNPILYTLSTQQVRGILKRKLGGVWKYLRIIFVCMGSQEEEGEEEQQQGVDDEDRRQMTPTAPLATFDEDEDLEDWETGRHWETEV